MNFTPLNYFIKKLGPILIVVKYVLIYTVCTFILMPSTHYRIGNVFFGEVPSLYNVDLSQYFFIYSAYPPLGQAPEFAHYQLSRTYFIQGNLDAALDEAIAEISLYPDNIRTYYILGLTYGYLNRESEAIESFSKFIKHNPYSWAARNDMAWLQFRIGDIEGALATLEPVSTVNNPWVQNTYGTILLNLGRHEEARVAFEIAKEGVSEMTEEQWGASYPGNDPRVYSAGLRAMKTSINSNLNLLNSKGIK